MLRKKEAVSKRIGGCSLWASLVVWQNAEEQPWISVFACDIDYALVDIVKTRLAKLFGTITRCLTCHRTIH